jgi:hypothetical protein
MREHVVPRGQRRSRWGWALRLTGLVGLLSTAAAFGAGRIPSPLDSFGTAGQRPTATTLVSTTTAGPTLIAQGAAEQTAMALGVGGPDGGVASAERAASQGEQSPVEVGRGSLAAPAAPVPTAPPPAVIAPTGAETAAAGDESRAAAQVETETPDATPTRLAGAETRRAGTDRHPGGDRRTRGRTDGGNRARDRNPPQLRRPTRRPRPHRRPFPRPPNRNRRRP